MHKLIKVALLALAFVSNSSAFTRAQAADGTLVFAAASMQQSLDAVAEMWKKAGHSPVLISYAGSSVIARQIEQGAPADIFISANQAWMDYLSQRKLTLATSRRNLLGNSLVLIAPATSAETIDIQAGFDITSALNGGRLAMADIQSVPAGQYGEAALKSLGVWEKVEKSVVQGSNVRDALAFVARGEASLGIVYETDARIEPRVSIVGQFPADTHPAIIYPAAMTARAHSEDAADFFTFLQSPEATKIFESYGFSAPAK